MEEIDQMLDQWIYNSIIRARLRKLIVKAIAKKLGEAKYLSYIHV